MKYLWIALVAIVVIWLVITVLFSFKFLLGLGIGTAMTAWVMRPRKASTQDPAGGLST
jgi:uncharacterized protein HemY